MNSSMSINSKYWGFQLVGWLFFTSYFLLGELFFMIEGDKIKFLVFVLYYFTGLIGTHVYYLLLRHRTSVFNHLLKSSLVAILGCTLLASLFFIEQYIEIKYIIKDNMEFHFFDILASILLIIRNIIPWFFCFHIYKYSQQVRLAMHEIQKVELQLKKSELDNLKSQLHPHFLFNALNSIKSLMLSNVTLARDAITHLADILRSSLSIFPMDEIELSEELKLVDHYLTIEKLRYEDRLIFSKEINIDIDSIRLPPFCLQVLIENAVKHGISKLNNGGLIHLEIKKTGEDLIIILINNGILVESNRKGVGIENLIRRLHNKYGEKVHFSLKQTNENFVTCELIISNYPYVKP